MPQRQFSILGSLAAHDRQIRIAHGAHANDLPDGAADAAWIELHIWENAPPHTSIRQVHMYRDADASGPQPHTEERP